MRIQFLFALLLLAITAVFASSIPEQEVQEEGVPVDEIEIPQVEEHRGRYRRYTCDVLKSPKACDAHCKILLKPGGYCKNGTCYCNQWG